MSRKPQISLPGQLVIRNLEKLRGERILLFDCADREVVAAIRGSLPTASVEEFFLEYPEYLAAGEGATFGAWFAPEKTFDCLVLFLPKSRPLIEMVFAMLSQCLEPGASVYVVGANDAGIKSATKHVRAAFGEIVSSDAARHCTVYEAKKEVAGPEVTLASFEHSFTYEGMPLKSFPGVFGLGRVDDGSKLLLKGMNVPSKGRVLDVGCGDGFLGAVLKLKSPALVLECVDSSALALEATRLTLEANGLEAKIYPSDAFSAVQGEFDLIISNPPFHAGVHTEYRVAERIIRDSIAHLRVGGRLRLVANSFLPYERILAETFGEYKAIARTASFKVLEAVRTS